MQDKWLTDVAGLCGVQTKTTDLSPETSWRYMPYETMDGIKGTMIISSAVGDFRDLTLPLPSVGPCRIYIGIGCFGDFTRIKLRLGGAASEAKASGGCFAEEASTGFQNASNICIAKRTWTASRSKSAMRRKSARWRGFAWSR